MSLQTLNPVVANLDSRVAEWIISSLKEHPIARNLRRVAFVMPIDGEEELVLVNQKNGDIAFADDLPSETDLNATLEVGGAFYTFVAPPEGAADAYTILCDTQDLEERATEIDAVIPAEQGAEIPDAAPATEPAVESETDALYREIVESAPASATIPPVTMEEIDNGFDAVLADLDTLDNLSAQKETPHVRADYRHPPHAIPG